MAATLMSTIRKMGLRIVGLQRRVASLEAEVALLRAALPGRNLDEYAVVTALLEAMYPDGVPRDIAARSIRALSNKLGKV